ncbi:MAG: hypothetical protein A3D31_04480 [Candidatus Fluviicola riflensis]|nr:MAG: hypothetical protein CHH17_10545 [Candidatus Fluviicola riflensis]OGS79233.1 MAG: hypothetical protein A3D31_04480 [Candidatus Fluviicola riflensis]OGS86665.1 MAG: hypothetical protein A2724_03940 [Fluviicola sp. RIFCSPHIGHO2_01_FULL_43_53]OGS88861.1 MAG: hypothetical protein A3E30_00720 [Fluviicola sp. RIFCSPHIGHO2_12_FULL_43_24]
MHWNRFAAIVITGLLLTVACNKEEDPVINPCMNGQLDPGETAIDCGGTCGDCPDAEFPYAGFSYNGMATTASTKQLTYNNGWNLAISGDTVSMQLNLGNDGSVGTYTMSASGSFASYNGLNYPTLVDGVYSISGHNPATQKLSGFFQGKFVRVAGDTLYITNGFFEYLPY